ncbi:MAG: thioredoxin-disulfide reductase [Chloroflexi bacterium]|nr:thioredoxin-disulfide reductase [Chloroflexota bacterium]MBM4454147.1 thioredoxin-disulfide reductase [Chloroflexota bacterium]
MDKYDVIIVGGGPAGLTAGLYASRAGLKTLLLERALLGGQIVNAQHVENYPGFPDGISGFELASLMQQQATKYGLEITTADVAKVVTDKNYCILANDSTFEAAALIIAAGSEHRKLAVPGEDKLVGRGISYCATCDGFLFREQDVVVVGGGDTAITDALELSQHARTVHVVHRRDQLRAGQVLQQRAFSDPKIKFIWDTVVEDVTGEPMVNAIRLRNVKTGKTSVLQLAGVFVAIGLVPNSQAFSELVKLDETGHVITDELMATSAPGVFAAGDIRKNSARQVSSAVGDGATAAISVFRYLKER